MRPASSRSHSLGELAMISLCCLRERNDDLRFCRLDAPPQSICSNRRIKQSNGGVPHCFTVLAIATGTVLERTPN